MKYVLDASVAFKWVVPETDSDKADRLRDAFRNGVHELLAPDFFPAEVGNSLTRAERQGRIFVGDAVPLLTDVLRACPALHPSYPLLLRACDISSRVHTPVVSRKGLLGK
jgi:predicted nucleic acid-binding protein